MFSSNTALTLLKPVIGLGTLCDSNSKKSDWNVQLCVSVSAKGTVGSRAGVTKKFLTCIPTDYKVAHCHADICAMLCSCPRLILSTFSIVNHMRICYSWKAIPWSSHESVHGRWSVSRRSLRKYPKVTHTHVLPYFNCSSHRTTNFMRSFRKPSHPSFFSPPKIITEKSNDA